MLQDGLGQTADVVHNLKHAQGPGGGVAHLSLSFAQLVY